MSVLGRYKWAICFVLSLAACENTSPQHRTYVDELGEAIYDSFALLPLQTDVPADLLHRISLCQARVYVSDIPADKLAEMDADARGEKTASDETRKIVERTVRSRMREHSASRSFSDLANMCPKDAEAFKAYLTAE